MQVRTSAFPAEPAEASAFAEIEAVTQEELATAKVRKRRSHARCSALQIACLQCDSLNKKWEACLSIDGSAGNGYWI